MEKASKRAVKPLSDRLSGLSDDILCHILSFLDTKYAVATSVLSTRWKNLCNQVPNIILDYRTTTMSESDFARFGLGRIKIISRNVPYINKFRLKCNYTDPLIQTLVCTAVSRNVKELQIRTQSYTSHSLKLPPEIFTSRSLVVMKLKFKWYLDLPIPQLVCLPNLKVLHLEYVSFPGDHDSLRRLFEGCKLLQDLSLTRCRTMEHDVVLDLSIPSLRKLVIKYMYDATKLVIDSPNLEFFEYKGYQVEFRLVSEFKSLTSARISCPKCPEERDSVFELINKMHGIKFLYLSEWTMKSMQWDYPLLRVFEDLTRLELCVPSLKALLYILQSTPQLQVLLISLPEIKYGRLDEAGALCPVPACFAKHLKSIVFKGFLAREYEFELAKHLLQNGQVLETMKFEVHHLEAQELSATSKRISKFPKSSEKCEIAFVSNKEIRNY